MLEARPQIAWGVIQWQRRTRAVTAWPGSGDEGSPEATAADGTAMLAGRGAEFAAAAAGLGLPAAEAVASVIMSVSFFLRAASSLSVALSTGAIVPALSANAISAAIAACM